MAEKYITLTGLGQFLSKLKTGAASKTVMGQSLWGGGDIDISYNSSHFTYKDKKIALKVQHTTGYKFDSNKPKLNRISVGTMTDLLSNVSGISVPDPVNFSKGQEIFWPEIASTEISSTAPNGDKIYKSKSQYNLNYMTKPGVFTIHARHEGTGFGVDNQMNLPSSIALGSAASLQTRLTVTAAQCDTSFIRYDDDYNWCENDYEFSNSVISGHEVVTQKAEISGTTLERGANNIVDFSGTWIRTGYRTVTDSQKTSNTNVPFTWTEWVNQDPSDYNMNMVKAQKGTGKYWLLGHVNENLTATAYTHTNCYISGGKLYSNGKETINTSTFNPVKTDVESVKEKVSYVDLTALGTTWLSGDNYNYVGIGTAIEGDFNIGLWADTDNPGKKLTANFYLNFGGSGTVKFDASKGTYIALKDHSVGSKGVLALKVERIPWGQSNNKVKYLINYTVGTMVDSTKQSLVPKDTTAYTSASEVSEVSEE